MSLKRTGFGKLQCKGSLILFSAMFSKKTHPTLYCLYYITSGVYFQPCVGKNRSKSRKQNVITPLVSLKVPEYGIFGQIFRSK